MGLGVKREALPCLEFDVLEQELPDPRARARSLGLNRSDHGMGKPGDHSEIGRNDVVSDRAWVLSR
jgi:hypothetical protein